MIDLENTNGSGLKGAQYLNSSDTVVIFYSAGCKHLEQRILQEIFDSGCRVELCRLIKKGENALNFYIASKIGALFGGGYSGGVAIVSEDKGFQAVNHYWQNYGEPNRHVAFRPNIEQSIIALNEMTPRQKQIKEALQSIDFEKAVAEHEEMLRIQQELKELFSGTPQEEKLPQIMGIIAGQSGTGRVLYLSALKQFGRKDGLEIYRKLRQLRW